MCSQKVKNLKDYQASLTQLCSLNQKGNFASIVNSFSIPEFLDVPFDVPVELQGECLFQLGFAYGEFDELEKAISCYTRAIAIGFRRAGVFFNLANAYRISAQPNLALEMYRKALELEPDREDVLANLGFVYEDLGLLQQSEEAFLHVAARGTQHPESLTNAAYVLLRNGDYKRGWDIYERRIKSVPHPALSPTWNGVDSVVGKSVLCVVEQGFGDIIMFSGLLPALAKDASRLALACNSVVLPLLSSGFPDLEIVDFCTLDFIKSWDIVIGLASLGKLYRSVLSDQFEPIQPYARPDPAAVVTYRQALSKFPNRLKIGIAWSGGLDLRNQMRRSVPLHLWLPILSLPGIDWINLQHHPDRSELDSIREKYSISIHDLVDCDTDLVGTVAVLNSLDCVITVQQTLVHLAGVTGVSAHVMVPLIPEWRYGSKGTQMPWWESVKLYRQTELGNWSDVVDSIARSISFL